MLIPVDSSRFSVVASGKIAPATEWIERADGGRARSDVQATNDRGLPLWEVEVFYDDRIFGQDSSERARVSVPAQTEPKIAPFTPIQFVGLTVNAYASKGSMRTNFSAEGIAAAKPAQADANRG